MPCNACGKVYDVTTLTCIKHPETVAEKLVSAGNKLSVAKFLCPEPGCQKSVDVKYMDGNNVNIARYHEPKGTRVSVHGGTTRSVVTVKAPSLSQMAELFESQMRQMVGLAVEEIKSADNRIEAQLALIIQAEERIASITVDKVKAEEILSNPEYAKFLPVDVVVPVAVVEEAVAQ